MRVAGILIRMAKSRAFNRNLTRILSRTDAAVYIVEDERIAFANQTLLDLTGLDADALKDIRCVYSSSGLDNSAENLLRGFAPPPNASDGMAIPFEIFCRPEDSPKRILKAVAIPFPGLTGSGTAVLVFASPDPDSNLFDVASAQTGHTGIDFDPRELHRSLEQLSEILSVRYSRGSLIGESPFARLMRRKLDAVTESNASVLITGPPGSGKEHLARTIFTCRSRAIQGSVAVPVVIDCPVADPELVQRTLRESRRPASADALTTPLLLLDVDKLAPVAQQELLGVFDLPGARFPAIATSELPFQSLLHSRRFDNSLARHLNTISLDLLPLCERIEDVPAMAQSFLEKHNVETDAHQKSGFSATVVQMFTDYGWPGNLDELASVVRQSCENSSAHTVQVSDLPQSFLDACRARDLERPGEIEIDLAEYLESIEKQLIARAMQQTGGNKAGAARLLGISRPKLLRRLQATGLSDSAPPEEDFIDPSEFEEADD